MTEPSSLLAWGVRSSLWSYVTNGGGRVAAVAPALVDGSIALFPGVPRSPADEGRAFSGGLSFTAHGGMLQIGFQNLELSSVDDAFIVSAELEAGSERIPLAAAQHLDSAEGLHRFDAWLTPAGSALFCGYYRAGEPLDPFTVLVPPGEQLI